MKQLRVIWVKDWISDDLGKIGRSLMDNWGKIRQLINILFCGYRRLEIHYPLSEIRDP